MPLAALRVNPLTYSFLAGAIVSLAGNIYSSAFFATQVSVPAWQIYVVVVLQCASGVFFFATSVRLAELRELQISMRTPPDPKDLDLLLANKPRIRPIKLMLLAAIMSALGSFLLLGLP